MMPGLPISIELPLPLPWYLAIPLFVSWVLWLSLFPGAKINIFRNKKDFLDVISLWGIILFTFIPLSLIIPLFNYMNSVVGFSDLAFYMEVSLVAFAVSLLLFILYTDPHKSTCSTKRLKDFFKIIILLHLGVLCLLFSLSLLFLILSQIYLAKVIILLVSEILLSLLTALLINQRFKKEILTAEPKVFRENNHFCGFLYKNMKRNIQETMLVIIFLSVLLLLFLPIVESPENGSVISYKIIDSQYTFKQGYALTSVPIEVKTFGRIAPALSSITIDLRKYGLASDKGSKLAFNVNINTSDNRTFSLISLSEISENNLENELNKYGFKSYLIDITNKKLTLRFDEKTIKQQNISKIILQGYVPIQINDSNYSFEKTNSCSNLTCSAVIKIKSNFSSFVREGRDGGDLIFSINNNYPPLVEAKCLFSNVSISLNNEVNYTIYKQYCFNEKHCDIEIRQQNVSDFIFRSAATLRNDAMFIESVDTNGPLEISANYSIQCSP